MYASAPSDRPTSRPSPPACVEGSRLQRSPNNIRKYHSHYHNGLSMAGLSNQFDQVRRSGGSSGMRYVFAQAEDETCQSSISSC